MSANPYLVSGQVDKHGPRGFARTPSPTPSETAALLDDGKIHPEKLLLKENRKYLVLAIVGAIAAAIFVILHVDDKIVDALEPAAHWMYKTKGGFLIPIAILVVLSIPPLFGHEIVIVLVGLAWGLGYGFAIACAGTILGELLTFFLFKVVLRKHAAKQERDSIRFALLARVIREGGLVVAVVARYSVIPGHLLTALFATCGISVVIFLISAVSSLPKQFVGVYLGYALKLTAEGQSSKTSKIVKYVVLAITVILTVFSARFIHGRTVLVRDAVVYDRRKARQAGGVLAPSTGGGSRSAYGAVPLDDGDAEDLPLRAYAAPMGAAPLYAPQPMLAPTAAGLVSDVRATSPAVLPEADAYPSIPPPHRSAPNALAAPAYPPPGRHFAEPSDDDDDDFR